MSRSVCKSVEGFGLSEFLPGSGAIISSLGSVTGLHNLFRFIYL